MSNPPMPTTSGRTPWGWLPFALLLGGWGHLVLAEELSLAWEPGWFIVLLGAWLGGEYGWPALKPMLLVGVFAVFTIYFDLSPAFTIGHGFGVIDYLLALAACAAFARNRDGLPANSSELIRKWWRPAFWLAMFVLAVTVHKDNNIEYGEMVVWTCWPGALLALAILMSPMNWVGVMQRLRTQLSMPIVVILIVTVAAALSVTVYGTFDEDGGGPGFYFGLSLPNEWLILLSFLAAAGRWVDWRLLIGLLFAGFIAAMVSGSGAEDLAALAPIPLREDVDAGLMILSWRSFIDSICAVLLGTVLSPLWLSWSVAPMRTWRTAVFLGAVLVLQYVVIPLYSPEGSSRDNILILAGVAFVGALVWRGKGLLVFPLLLLLCPIVAAPLSSDEVGPGLLDGLLRVGGLIFPFAFMGLLSNRYERASPAPTWVGTLQAKPAEGAV